MRTDLFDFHLPQDQIAQQPLPRGSARLLVLRRETGCVEHRRVDDLPELLSPSDSLVMNDTLVTARRVTAVRDTGLSAEVLLLRQTGPITWEALVRPGRGFQTGRSVTLQGPGGATLSVRVAGSTAEGGRVLVFDDPLEAVKVATWGEVPLPPYITSSLGPERDAEYQTVYAAKPGSAAAPTAGLHFSKELLQELSRRGIRQHTVTLTVGVGTFRPVKADDVEMHTMHSEPVSLTAETASALNATTGRIVAVGTTSVRVLETAAADVPSGSAERVQPFTGETCIFIRPGYQFRAVDALLTNFHLPKSTLLMLVCAFAGLDPVMAAYREAVAMGYRFFSFGDAMLIV